MKILNEPNKPSRPMIGEKKETEKKTGKIRLIFGRHMSPEAMLDAVIRTAKEYDVPLKDNRKELGIPIVDSR